MAHLCQSLSQRIQTLWWGEEEKIKEGKNEETKIFESQGKKNR